MMLTIAIPTYNRPKQLRDTLTRLLPQLDENCFLLILDNHSDTFVEELVGDLLVQYSNIRYKILRNKANIGGDSNIIRCFELCETEWLWTLGDDDHIRKDAILTIFEDIKTYPDLLNINYNSPSIERPLRAGITISRNLHEFINNTDAIGSMIYISCNVYNNYKLRKGIYPASFNTYSCASQWLVLLYTLMYNDHQTILSNKVICENPVIPAVFSDVTLNVPKGFSTFLDIDLEPPLQRVLIRKLAEDSKRWFSMEGVLKSLLIKLFLHKKDFDINFSFSRYYYLLYGHFGFLAKCKFRLLQLLLFVSPKLSFSLVKIMYFKKTGRKLVV